MLFHRFLSVMVAPFHLSVLSYAVTRDAKNDATGQRVGAKNSKPKGQLPARATIRQPSHAVRSRASLLPFHTTAAGQPRNTRAHRAGPRDAGRAAILPVMDSPPAEGVRTIGGRYRLLAQIGQGGMGVVWRAHDDLLGRTVAVKEVILPQIGQLDRADLRRRTMREARAAARLSHPNAVTVHDVIEEDGQPWIVMQLLAAESLSDLIKDTGPLPPRRVAEIGLALLDALRAAHAAGILHRDVKPGNVLIGHDGRVVLTDFGIATLEGDPSLTSTGLLLGAPAYIAPERARGAASGAAADLWSLGATLYCAVEGRQPYDYETPMATLMAVATEDPAPPRLAGPLVPLLDGLLRRDPAQRVDGATAQRLLIDALNADGPHPRETTQVIEPLPPLPAAPDELLPELRAESTAESRPGKPRRRVLWWVAAAVAGLLAVGFGGSAVLSATWPRPTTSPRPQAAPTTVPSAQAAPANLPGPFVADWSGRVVQQPHSTTWTANVNLTGGPVGSVVGTSRYPTLGCSGQLRLVSVPSSGQVRLAERIVVQGHPRCTPTVGIDLSLGADGTLHFSGTDGGVFDGTLRRR